MKISGTYVPASWNESDSGMISSGKKTTKVSAEFQFHGDIEGLAIVEYLMFYSSFDVSDMHASTAQFVGQLTIKGLLQGKRGTFVLHDSGTFVGGKVNSRIEIVSHSGTEDLKNISGSGSYTADASGCNWELEIAN